MSCTLCPLHESAGVVCVQGRGPIDAPILIVGQNPGAEEDLAGRAFVGPSGLLLEEMLRDAGFSPTEYRLTNAVRCITPRIQKKLRAPFPNEIDACRVHLMEEIHAVKPKVIIAMGVVALQALTGLKDLSGKRGQPQPLHANFGYVYCDVYPTFHPAYVLRTPMARNTVVSDLRRVRDVDRPADPIKWVWAKNLMAGPTLPIAYDIEAIDEQCKIVDYPTQVALCAGDVTGVSTPESLQTMLDYLKGRPNVISHFGWDYDDAKTGIRSTYDTAALAYLDDETQPLGLESLAVKYLGVRGWKEARSSPLGSDDLAEYNARDALYTLQLFEYFQRELGTSRNGAPRIRIAEQILRPLRDALNACTERGLYIDGEEVEKERVKQAARIEALHVRLRALLEEWNFDEHVFDKHLKTKVNVVPFNPNSGAHVAAVLLHLGYELPKTATEKDGTDAETLGRINHPFARAMLEYREATKRMSTYILPYAKIAADIGRAHPTYTVIRTLTGRTSAKNRNVQNLDRELKSFFSAAPGRVLVKADYQAIEFWVAVWLAKVDRLINARLTDTSFDPHKYFASILYGKPESEITKAQRQVAKSAHFALLYGGGPSTIVHYMAGLGEHITMAMATIVFGTFQSTYPEFGRWHTAINKEMREYGYVESPTGRRRHTGDVRLLAAGGALADAQREAANAMCQGFATGDISELGLIACHQAGLPVAGFIHDEILFEFDTPQYASLCLEQIRHCMIEEPVRVLREQFYVDFPIQLLGLDVQMVTGVQYSPTA